MLPANTKPLVDALVSPAIQTTINAHSIDLDAIVICIGVRTAICKAGKGAFKSIYSDELLVPVLQEVMKRAPDVPMEAIGDVVVGTCLQPGGGQAMARMAALQAGYPHTVPVMTVNRQCASGLQAIASVADAIRSKSYGSGTFVHGRSSSSSSGSGGNRSTIFPAAPPLQVQLGVAAGVESMSTCPMEDTAPIANWAGIKKHRAAAACMIPMGVTSENIARKYNISRQDMDAYALESHRRASLAQEKGYFDAEIVSIYAQYSKDGRGGGAGAGGGAAGKGEDMIDGGIRKTCSLEGLSALKPVFVPKDGTATAGNSSQTSDGAAAVLLVRERERQQMGLPVLCVWKEYVVVGVPPEIMGVGPAYAIPALLHKAGLRLQEIDVFEINEAFASQVLFCINILGIDRRKVNPQGGALALGHPLGCSGTRLVITCANHLKRNKLRYGVVSLCVGTGMGAAALVENPDYDFKYQASAQHTAPSSKL